jgi:chromosome segregation ATPase
MTKAERKKFIKNTFSATEVGVLIEDMQNGIQVIGEQHGDIIKKIDDIKDELCEFKGEMSEFKGEMSEFKGEMSEFKGEMKANFKAVFEYLSRIEDDFVALRKKVEKLDTEKISPKDFNWLKNKVLELEKRLDEYKKQQTVLASKI